MQLKHYSAAKLKKELLKIIDKYLDLKLYKVFIFGSRVMGRGSERSDIDVGIMGVKEIPLDIMARIKDDIVNLPSLYTIDIVDFKSVSREFRKVALKKVEFL